MSEQQQKIYLVTVNIREREPSDGGAYRYHTDRFASSSPMAMSAPVTDPNSGVVIEVSSHPIALIDFQDQRVDFVEALREAAEAEWYDMVAGARENLAQAQANEVERLERKIDRGFAHMRIEMVAIVEDSLGKILGRMNATPAPELPPARPLSIPSNPPESHAVRRHVNAAFTTEPVASIAIPEVVDAGDAAEAPQLAQGALVQIGVTQDGQPVFGSPGAAQAFQAQPYTPPDHKAMNPLERFPIVGKSVVPVDPVRPVAPRTRAEIAGGRPALVDGSRNSVEVTSGQMAIGGKKPTSFVFNPATGDFGPPNGGLTMVGDTLTTITGSSDIET